MMRASSQRQRIIENLTWFGVALLLAFIVWLTASLASDPSGQRMLQQLPISILVDDNMIITSTSPSNQQASVTVRAPSSMLEELTTEDIQVIANLSDTTESGRHTVTLQAVVSDQRQASVEFIRPSQITVELQQRQERLIPLELVATGVVPATVESGTPTSNITQVLVTGPANAVSQVAAARVSVDLTDRRETFEEEERPQLFNADGIRITGLSVSPEIVGVTVVMQPRSDVREVRVTPNIIGEPPEGYTLSADFEYSPQTIFVTGPPEDLEELPGTLLTSPIDLSVYTDDFEIRVPVELPGNSIVPITGQRITVNIGIDPIQSSRQFEGVDVEVIGLPDGFTATVTPGEVTMLVTGPQLILADLAVEDIRVIVDAGSLTEPGTFQLEPVATVNVAQIESDNISLIPATVDIQLRFAEPPTPSSSG